MTHTERRFIRDNVAWCKRDLTRESMWTFVYSKETPEAVPGSMPIVHAVLPELVSRKYVELSTTCASGEGNCIDRDMPLQDACEGFALLESRLLEVYCTRRITSAVKVLST